MNAKELARFWLEHGSKFPYDRPDSERKKAKPAKDWAHVAARGILADLSDRRGIRNELEKCDEDVRMELVKSLARIIRLAHGDQT